MILKLGMQHPVREYYQIPSNDDPMLTFDLFTQKSILVPHAFVIHVIFSWAQIGRSAIFGREIGVPDREIFRGKKKKKIKFNVKNCLFASA